MDTGTDPRAGSGGGVPEMSAECLSETFSGYSECVGKCPRGAGGWIRGLLHTDSEG